MNLHKLNVGIIGGGIGGVAAAVALQRAGIDTTVYERAPELREVGAGMMLWPNATRVLKELGLLKRVSACSGPNQHFLVRSSAGAVLMDIGLGQFEVPALCTRRSDLLDALLSALPRERIRLGHELTRLEQLKSGVRVHFANGCVEEHDAVIGADGILLPRAGGTVRHFRSGLPRLYNLAGSRRVCQPRDTPWIQQRNLGTRQPFRHSRHRPGQIHVVRDGQYSRMRRRPCRATEERACVALRGVARSDSRPDRGRRVDSSRMAHTIFLRCRAGLPGE